MSPSAAFLIEFDHGRFTGAAPTGHPASGIQRSLAGEKPVQAYPDEHQAVPPRNTNR